MSSMLQWNHYRKDLIRFPKMYMLIVKRCKNIYLLIPESQYVINNIVRRLQFLSERVWSVWESRLAKNCFNNKSACLNSIYIYIYIKVCLRAELCGSSTSACPCWCVTV